MTDIHDIYRAVKGFEQDLIARVPEHIFIDSVLPLLAGEPGGNLIEVWEHLAGTLFNKMHIVDPAGQVMFTLPSLAVSPKTSGSERKSQNSLYEIMQGYEMRTNISPLFALRYMEDSLKDKVDNGEFDYESVMYIDEILVKYGKPPRLPPELSDAIKKVMAKKKAEAEGKEYVDPTSTEVAAVPDVPDLDL